MFVDQSVSAAKLTKEVRKPCSELIQILCRRVGHSPELSNDCFPRKGIQTVFRIPGLYFTVELASVSRDESQ